MEPLQPGLYESLLTEQLRQAIAAMADRAKLDTLDKAEAPALLAQFLQLKIQQALENEDGDDHLEKRLQIANGILETLWAIAIGLGLFVLLELFLKAGRTHAVESVTCRLDARVDRRLLERLLAQRGPMPPVGVMLARYRDLVASRDFLSSSWLMALVDVPFAALYLVVIGLIAGPLVWVPLVIAVVMVAIAVSLIVGLRA